MKHLMLLAAAALLAGCAAPPKPAQVDFAAPRVAQLPAQAATRPATGSLFQPVTYRPSFEDRRARQVGDTVTIRIVENVTASQKSSSTANRSSSIDGSITAATREQSVGIGQVSQAVAALDRVTQENAALVEQSAGAAATLKARSQGLEAAVAGYQVTPA